MAEKRNGFRPTFLVLLFLLERGEADACHLQQIVGQSHNPELGVDLLQPSQGEAPERAIALDVTEHAFYLDFAPGIDRGFLVILKGVIRCCF